MHRTVIRSIGVVLLVATAPVWAHAQQQAGRPYRGLFGGGVVGAPQALTLHLSTGAGYDTNVLAAATLLNGTQDPGIRIRTLYSNAVASLGYSHTLSRLSIHATAAANAVGYRGLSRGTFTGYHGSIGANFQLWGGSNLGYSQSFSYSPVYATPLSVPGLPGAGVFDPIFGDDTLGLMSRNHGAGNVGLSFTQPITSRLSLNFGYHYSRSSSRNSAYNLWSHGGRAGVSYAIGRGLGIRVGYAYTNNYYGLPGLRQRVDTGSVDGGLTFSKALSLTRKTTLSFNTGSMGVVGENRTHYMFVGNAHLTRELGRSWTAGLGYNRSVNFVDTFLQPVPSEAVTANVGGFLNQRMNLSGQGGIVRGRVGLVRINNGLRNYFGRAALTFGITRNLGAALHYSYFRYHFDQNITLIQTQRRQGDRHRIGLNFQTMLPIFVRRGGS